MGGPSGGCGGDCGCRGLWRWRNQPRWGQPELQLTAVRLKVSASKVAKYLDFSEKSPRSRLEFKIPSDEILTMGFKKSLRYCTGQIKLGLSSLTSGLDLKEPGWAESVGQVLSLRVLCSPLPPDSVSCPAAPPDHLGDVPGSSRRAHRAAYWVPQARLLEPPYQACSKRSSTEFS